MRRSSTIAAANRRRILLILLSAGVHALAMPPWSVSAAAWVALVPLLIALRGLTPGRAALFGLSWGTAAIWGVGYWVPLALAHYYDQPYWFGIAFSLAASIVFAGSYYAGFGACAAWTCARTVGAVRIVMLATLWVTWELARARLLTGDPWLLLGYALVPVPTLAQAADLGGVYLLSFAIMVVNASLAEAWGPPADAARTAERTRMTAPSTTTRTRRAVVRALVPGAVTMALLVTYGSWRLAMRLPDAPAFRLAVVQGNNDLGAQWRREFYGRGLAEYVRLTTGPAGDAGAKLVVWPESAITFFLTDEPAYRAQIAGALSTIGADLIVGGPHYENGRDHPRYFNSAFYVTRDGRIAARYDKARLLPFAEYFPLRTIEFLRRRFEQVRFFTPGTGATMLATPYGDVATVICFEGIFPDLVRRAMAAGAGLLVNLSNDAWLGHGAGPEQHLAMVTLRAIENRTWLIRATTTGISAIVDPYGRVRQRSGSFTSEVLSADVVPLHLATVYKRVGDAFAYGCVLASLVGATALRRRSRRGVV